MLAERKGFSLAARLLCTSLNVAGASLFLWHCLTGGWLAAIVYDRMSESVLAHAVWLAAEVVILAITVNSWIRPTRRAGTLLVAAASVQAATLVGVALFLGWVMSTLRLEVW